MYIMASDVKSFFWQNWKTFYEKNSTHIIFVMTFCEKLQFMIPWSKKQNDFFWKQLYDGVIIYSLSY